MPMLSKNQILWLLVCALIKFTTASGTMPSYDAIGESSRNPKVKKNHAIRGHAIGQQCKGKSRLQNGSTHRVRTASHNKQSSHSSTAQQLRTIGKRKVGTVTAVSLSAFATTAAASAPLHDVGFRKLRYSVLSLLLPWMYFMCVSINIPTLPKYINWCLNKGDINVSNLSAQVYGNVSGIDALFTFLSVNLVGCLSDVFGRRLFMFLSSLGIGAAFFVSSCASTPAHFYLAACIDGLTSCMLSQSQAYITDHQAEGANLSVALAKFQGVAIGLAFMFGIPLGAAVGNKYGIRTPLYLAMAISAVNCLLIAFALPTAPDTADVTVLSDAQNSKLANRSSSSSSSSSSSTDSSIDRSKIGIRSKGSQLIEKLRRVNWEGANPFGAALMLMRSRRLLVGGLAYFLVNLTQSGVQVVWVNYLQYRYGMSATTAGATLMLVGLIVAVVPAFIIPLLGVVRSFKYCLLLHSLSIMGLASSNSVHLVFLGMPFLAAGASAMPILLGFLTQQVSKREVGALQGAADTVRTISSMIGSPMFARTFAQLISVPKDVAFPQGSLYFASVFSLLGYLLVAAL